METILTVIHVVACVLVVLVVLIQSGKGAEISASLGGSSQTVFGSSGGANFFTRFTSVMAAIFMATSIGLTILKSGDSDSLFDSNPTQTQPTQPTQSTQSQPAQAAQPAEPAKAPAKK